MSKLPQKENNINYHIQIIFFAHLPTLHEAGTRREHIILKLTESHPNNIFSYKDAHILTFYIKLHFPVGYVCQHICQHSHISEGVFPNFRLSQVLVL